MGQNENIAQQMIQYKIINEIFVHKTQMNIQEIISLA